MFRSGRGSVAAEDAIHVQTIKAVPEKVDLVEFHPVSPWLAYVTRENTVAVWDYNSDQVIKSKMCVPEAALRDGC